MSRLIDADALKAALVELTHGEQRMIGSGDVMDIIDEAETVEAVPVEWMNEKMQNPQVTCVNPFGFVLAEWLEERMQCD